MNRSHTRSILATLSLTLFVIGLPSALLALFDHAPVRPRPIPPPIAGAQVAAPIPTPDADSWTLLSNTSFGYTLHYPTNWTRRELGQVDNYTVHMVTFNAPGRSIAYTISLRITKRSFARELELAKDELGEQPSRQVIVTGLTGAQFTGNSYSGGRLRVVVLPAARGTYILTIHYNSDTDPDLSTFEQLLTSFQIAQYQPIYIPIMFR